MSKIPKAVYQTVEQVEDLIKVREAEAALIEPGAARQSVLIEIAQLRAYASVKRWVSSPSPRTQGKRDGRSQRTL